MPAFWLINLALFQLGWFAALLLNQHAVAILASTVLLHFCLSPTKKADLLILLLAPIGWVLDYSLFQLDYLGTDTGIFPIWLLLLWVSFILSLNHSLKWLSQQHRLIASLSGMIFGPLSYLSATKVGVLTSSLTPLVFILVFGALWALLLPTLLALRHRLFKYLSPPQRRENT